MKIYFVAEPFQYGEILGLTVALEGEDVPQGQIRQAILLPGRNAPWDIDEAVRRLRQLADWIERQTPKPAFQLIDSPIFGKTRTATDEEIATIRKLVDVVPVTVFGALNKALNERGLMITIDALAAARN